MANSWKRWNGYASLFGGFLCHILVGSIFMIAHTRIYITSYFSKYKDDLTIERTAYIILIQGGCQGVGFLMSPYLISYISPKLLVVFGGALAVGGLIGATLVTNYNAFMLLLGIYFGFGIGTCFFVPFF